MQHSRELVRAAFANGGTDRVPVSFWFHFTDDEARDGFAHPEMFTENIEGHRAYHDARIADFIKIMSDGFFAYPNAAFREARRAGDLAAVESIGRHHPWIDRQVEHVKRVVDLLDGTPGFYNLFSPATLFRFACAGAGKNGDALIADMIAEDGGAVRRAFDVVAADMAIVAEGVVSEAGADGIYLSVQDIQDKRVTAELHRSIIAPGEKVILTAAKCAGIGNILHICGYEGHRNDLRRFAEYPADAVNWAAVVEGVSLGAGKALFGGKPVIGGFGNTKTDILYSGSKDAVQRETRRLLSEAGRCGVILGADCTVPRDIDWDRFRWVREAAA